LIRIGLIINLQMKHRPVLSLLRK